MSRRRSMAFTLIELMVVIAIVAVLAAIAIHGVRRYLAASRTAEAKDGIGGITRAIITDYERLGTGSAILTPGGPPLSPLCPPYPDCPPAELAASCSWYPWCAVPCPPVPIFVPSGAKYQPSTAPGVDFQNICWQRLSFSIDHPIHYQYQLITDGTFVGPPLGGPDPGQYGVEAVAIGDLDGDGVHGTFTCPIAWDPAVNGLRTCTRIFEDRSYE